MVDKLALKLFLLNQLPRRIPNNVTSLVQAEDKIILDEMFLNGFVSRTQIPLGFEYFSSPSDKLKWFLFKETFNFDALEVL